MRKLFKNKEKKNLKIHIYEWNIDVYVPENEEQRYIKATEKVNKKNRSIYGFICSIAKRSTKELYGNIVNDVT